ENSRTPEDIRGVLEHLIAWLAAPEQARIRRAFTVWMRRVLLPGRLPGTIIPEVEDLAEVKSMLAERVKEWTKEWERQGLEKGRLEGRQEGRQEGRLEGRLEGRQEGRQEGRREGEAALLLRMVELKFGPTTDAVRQRLHSAGPEDLAEWSARILTATSLEELFG
ncbi:MAG: transposase, partial [Thermodesulfobacteriota bacterium]